MSGPATIALLAAAWGLVTGQPDALPVPAGPPPARTIHEQHIHIPTGSIRALCTDGTRRVMLWHGEGGSAEVWRPVLARLDGAVGACAFERRGSGESLPIPEPRGWYELLDELRQIHLALGFEERYVLVGHGLGAQYARLYAADRPTELGALLLLEPAHEELPRELRSWMPRAEWSAWVERRSRPNRDGVIERSLDRRAVRSRLPDLPVTVVTAAIRPDGDGWEARFLNEATRRVHESIVRATVRGRHIPAERSGPNIHVDQPDLVTNEILRMVRAVRRRGG